jgi:3-hydroxybutyryl-CoA dehydrogenase
MADITRVGVCGSGQMGSGIAQVAAVSGYEVVIRSRNANTAQACVAGVEKALSKLVEKEKIEQSDADAAVARIVPTENLHDLTDCDLVIESVVEDMETKKALFNELDRLVAPTAVLATNTSTLSVTELAVQTARPDKVVGIHFFNPAPVMSLVEVVHGLTTSEETVRLARGFAEACGKNPVLVEDRAGFIVNALLFPYLNNAVRLLELGIASRDDIDTAMKGGCNFPMGPLALLDLVGLDTSKAILDALYEEYGDPAMRPRPLLKRMVAADRLGRKSGAGFYDYG